MLKKIIFCCLNLYCLGVQATSSTLIVGTNAEFPPFAFIQDEKIVGFDIDMVAEIAKRQNKEMVIKDMPFDALIPEVTLSHVDVVAAGMSYTEERAKRVSFTKCYLNSDPLIIFSKAQKPLSYDRIKGKTIVVVEGFTTDQFMSENQEIELLRLGTQADAFMAIKCERADAFITAKSTVDAFFENQNSSQYHTEIINDVGETCAMIIPKSKPGLLKEIQNTLDDMENDGTLKQLKVKWKLQ